MGLDSNHGVLELHYLKVPQDTMRHEEHLNILQMGVLPLRMLQALTA